MKKIVFAIALIAVAGLALFLFPGLSTDAVSSGRTVKAEFSVERLTCGSCVENIRQAVGALDGVASVATSVALKQTQVEFDPDKLDAVTIADTITRSGYPAQLYAQQNDAGQMVTDVDIDLYIARIGQRLVSRSEFNELVEQQRVAASESGQTLPVQYMVRFAWMTILQRELLLSAAADAGVTIANAELDVYIRDKQVAPIDREKVRNELILQRFFEKQGLDAQQNSAALSSLLQNLQQQTQVQIYDAGLKQSLSTGSRQGSGCGGGCCG